MNKYANNSSKSCVLKVDLEYSKELWGLQNDHPLAPDKIEIKKEMLFKYQLMCAGFYNILIGNTKKSVPNNSENEKYVLRYESFQIYLRLGLKEKKHDVLKFNQ